MKIGKHQQTVFTPIIRELKKTKTDQIEICARFLNLLHLLLDNQYTRNKNAKTDIIPKTRTVFPLCNFVKMC